MNNPEPVRVVILDDDPVFRRILARTFEAIAGAKVVAAVATAQEAKRQLDTGNVDLITLDVVLEGSSGLDFLPWITQHHPKVLTVILTAGSERRASQTIDAILLGAASLVLKPSGPQAPQQLQAALRRIIEGVRPPRAVAAVSAVKFASCMPAPREVLAIGASTGGPPQVLQLLRCLPQTLRLPICITQHMAAEHLGTLAALLSYPGGRAVRLAQHGELLRPDTVYLANDNKHLLLSRVGQQLILKQDAGPEEHFCRPAVDPMLRSVARTCGAAAVGVVLTGMGVDGAQGATALRQGGAPVLVQDQASSVVWGMPGAVTAAGAALETVPGSQMGLAVARWITGWLPQAAGPTGTGSVQPPVRDKGAL